MAADVSSITSVVLSIGQMIQSFVAGKKKAKELEEYFDKGKRVIDDLGSSLGNTIKGVAADLAAGSKAIGGGIADGVSKGLKDGLKSVKMKTKELGEDGVIKEFETTLEINSPSKVMKRIGGYIADGLGDGIKDGSKTVKSAMGDITDTVEKTAKKTSKTKFSFGGIAAVARSS